MRLKKLLLVKLERIELERERLKKLRLEHKEQEQAAWEATKQQYQKELLHLEQEERERTKLEEEDETIKKHLQRMKSFESDFDQQVAVFDRNNPSFVSSFVPARSTGKSFESSFDDKQAFVFDRDNPDAPDTKFDSITRIGVFDRDNPHQPPSKKIGVFDRDNPAAKCTDPLSRMGNVFPLISPRKGTGNRFSIVFDRDKGPFTRTGNFVNVDPVPLISDLEPDRSIYHNIDHVAYFQFLLLTGNFIDHVVYFQFLLLTGNLFVTNSFISCF